MDYWPYVSAEYAEELEKVMADLATYSPDAPALYTHTPG